MNRFENNMILYRPVGLQELELIYDSGMKGFPARLPQQPIFYPVLHLEYARQIASDWNVKSGQLAGYVTQFRVEDQYIRQFETHTVGETQHEELWIPAEEVEEFNRHIVGHIKVVEAHFGDTFQGYIPDKFGLQGKNAVEQFTLLANSYIYSRMDFYLEIKRNHKAVFLNYPFWLKCDFKNQGLKDKVLQAIKEAWLTSFPKIPLPVPILEEVMPSKQTDSHGLVKPVPEETAPVEEADSHVWIRPPDKDAAPVNRTGSLGLGKPVDKGVTSSKQTASHFLAKSAHAETTPVRQTGSHFMQGVKLGLSGKYSEAKDELSMAVEEETGHVVAHTSLGVVFHRLGEDDRALACYEAALKIDPKYAEAHYFRANLLHARGDVREAIAGYTIAIGLEPELIEAHQRPIPQDRLTDYHSAPAGMYWIAKPAYRILDFNKSLESNPRQASILKERAAEYYRLRNYEQAIADYSSSLAIQPDDASVLHYRGLAYEQMGQLDRALEDYQQAITNNPQLSDLYINRGVALGKMGQFRQSVASLSEGIRLAPRNPDGYFNRGMTYFQQGEFDRAIDDFSMVIQLSSNDEAAYYWRGISYEKSGRPGEAISDYRRFLEISQDEYAREEIEQKLSQWNVVKRERESSQNAVRDDRQETNQAQSEEQQQGLDIYDLIFALGERALDSTWFGSSVDCSGEGTEELYSFTDHNRPIEGQDLLRITSGIRQTVAGDFQAFDPGASAHWIIIRAWDGRGFYIETDDPKIKKRLTTHFQAVEEVEGAYPPYESLFIRI